MPCHHHPHSRQHERSHRTSTKEAVQVESINHVLPPAHRSILLLSARPSRFEDRPNSAEQRLFFSSLFFALNKGASLSVCLSHFLLQDKTRTHTATGIHSFIHTHGPPPPPSRACPKAEQSPEPNQTRRDEARAMNHTTRHPNNLDFDSLRHTFGFFFLALPTACLAVTSLPRHCAHYLPRSATHSPPSWYRPRTALNYMPSLPNNLRPSSTPVSTSHHDPSMIKETTHPPKL